MSDNRKCILSFFEYRICKDAIYLERVITMSKFKFQLQSSLNVQKILFKKHQRHFRLKNNKTRIHIRH